MLFDRIKVTNFLSHIETEVKLRGYDAIVVVGPNGSGKSSMMCDAPLVALFGKGRSGDLDGYIRNGKDMMIVEFDFSLSGQLYRIVRKRSKKTSRGTSIVSFYQIDGVGNVVMDLTAGSIGETESIIRKTIGTDFDTLVRSSIIEQGEADFFCKATPSERMELFAKVWDLEKYEDFEQMARDGARDDREKIKVFDELMSVRQKKILEIGESAKGLEGLKGQLGKEVSLINEEENHRAILQKKIGAFDGMMREIENVKAYQIQAEKEFKTIGEQHSEFLKKIERYTKILKNKETVFQKVEEEKGMVEAQEKHESTRQEINGKIDQMRANTDRINAEIAEKIKGLETENGGIQREIDAIDDRLDVLNRNKLALAKREEKLSQMRREAEKLDGIQCHPEQDATYINKDCRFIKDAVVARDSIESFEIELKQSTEEIDRLSLEYTTQKEELLGKRKVVDDQIKGFKHEIEGRVREMDVNISVLQKERALSDKQIEEIKKALVEVKKFTVLVPEISLANEELPKLKEEERNLSDRCNEMSKQIGDGKRRVGELTESLKSKGIFEKELQSVCNKLDDIVLRKDELIGKIGGIEAGLVQVKELSDQIKSDEKEIDRLTSSKAVYQVAEDAFKQIPYMLISKEIGTVENIANEILGMISSSGLRVTIRTEKMTKTTKKVKDEIHLIIQDVDGEKEYKFLSGGEKLRVALALRLAIGEVFAHRRGVSIESLLADEPFGPLDVEGIDDMKDAMRELKKRFGFMGVITHIERAMDIFPTRFVFEKSSGKGTVVSISDD